MMTRLSSKGGRSPAWMKKDILTKFKHKKKIKTWKQEEYRDTV